MRSPWLSLLVAASLTPACVLPFDPALLDGGSVGRCQSDEPCAGVDCCAQGQVPGGPFDRGYDASDTAVETDEVVGWQVRGGAPATISDFSLDLFEVTVGRFRTFVEHYDTWRASGEPAPRARQWRAEWSANLPASAAALTRALACEDASWTAGRGTREAWPVSCVTWYEAQAYCVWQGGRLPTEAEWNYAAAGGAEQRAFPWSSPAASRTVNESYAVAFFAQPAAVGSRAPLDAARWGHHDLAGNVREWVFDWAPDTGLAAYTESTVAPPCRDCVDDTPGTQRIRRGGAYDTNAARLRTAYRSAADPTVREVQLGFRCAR